MLDRFDAAATGFVNPAALAARFALVRDASVALAAPLSAEDCAAQSMDDASPVKWHLAHTSWFFETFVLERFAPEFLPFNLQFRMLFNSYYNGVGEKFARKLRGMLTRPGLEEVLAYRRHVDSQMAALLLGGLAAAAADELAVLIELGLQHEQQHQELIITDLKHLLSLNPQGPAYLRDDPAPEAAAHAPAMVAFAGGVAAIGHAGAEFCFDNEAPRHRVFLEPYSLASRLVTNAEYAAFIADGGYLNPVFWLSDGWAWVQGDAILHPLYWRADEAGGEWREFTLHGVRPLQANGPVAHLNYYEAAAYAAWAGARLPTEAEWEHAAGDDRLEQMFGAAWQWTSSSYAPYPGFAAAAGAVGEYNGKFMVNQYVLRGSSSATPAGHSRASYRNFFPAGARWQVSGVRLAK